MKRATDCPKSSRCVHGISIHALVKRATGAGDVDYGAEGYFNPRPREEGDTAEKSFVYEMRYFNPRPREEGDADVQRWIRT